MPRSIPGTWLVLAIILLTASACGDDDDNSLPTDPTTPTTITETFTGTLTRNGGVSHPFALQRSGLFTATVTQLAPDSTARVGVGLGTWNGVLCSVSLPRDDATLGTVVTGQASSFGAFCARVYDPSGIVTQALTYEIQVVHP